MTTAVWLAILIGGSAAAAIIILSLVWRMRRVNPVSHETPLASEAEADQRAITKIYSRNTKIIL